MMGISAHSSSPPRCPSLQLQLTLLYPPDPRHPLYPFIPRRRCRCRCSLCVLGVPLRTQRPPVQRRTKPARAAPARWFPAPLAPRARPSHIRKPPFNRPGSPSLAVDVTSRIRPRGIPRAFPCGETVYIRCQHVVLIQRAPEAKSLCRNPFQNARIRSPLHDRACARSSTRLASPGRLPRPIT